MIEDAQGLLAEVGQLDDLVAEARGAYTVAGGDPSVADAAGKPVGAVWEVRAGEETVRRFVLTGASTWTPVRVGADAIGAGVISADHIAAHSVAAAVANLLQINTEQLVVTEDAYLGRALAEQIAASLAAFELLVITAAQLAPDVGSNLDLAGNPALGDMASGADLTALGQRVDAAETSVQTVRNAVVIEPTGITVTDGQPDQNAVTISNSRVGFVAGGWEVAHIDGQSQQMLIDRMQVLSQAQVGRHVIESWGPDLTVVRWVG